MVEYLDLLRNILYTASAVALLFAVVFYLLYRRIDRMRQPPPRDPQDDLTNMRILFLTMRDMLEQQKDLARQLNENIDKKIAYMRRIAGEALEDLEKLRKAMRGLALQVDEARAELTSLQKQVGYVAQDTSRTSVEASRREPSEMPEGRDEEEGLTLEPEKPALHILASPSEEPPRADPLDQWVGLDLGSDERELQGFEPAEAPPEKPEDAEAARRAFKALLNIGGPQPEERSPASDRFGSGDGHSRNTDSITPLQARVYEYNDAGMTVPQIARELGIGKGEVRLILSLRQDKE